MHAELLGNAHTDSKVMAHEAYGCMLSKGCAQKLDAWCARHCPRKEPTAVASDGDGGSIARLDYGDPSAPWSLPNEQAWRCYHTATARSGSDSAGEYCTRPTQLLQLLSSTPKCQRRVANATRKLVNRGGVPLVAKLGHGNPHKPWSSPFVKLWRCYHRDSVRNGSYVFNKLARRGENEYFTRHTDLEQLHQNTRACQSPLEDRIESCEQHLNLWCARQLGCTSKALQERRQTSTSRLPTTVGRLQGGDRSPMRPRRPKERYQRPKELRLECAAFPFPDADSNRERCEGVHNGTRYVYNDKRFTPEAVCGLSAQCWCCREAKHTPVTITSHSSDSRSLHQPWCHGGLRTADTCCAAGCERCDDGGGPAVNTCKSREGDPMGCCRAGALRAGLCQSTDSVGCIIPGAGVAASQLCFAVYYQHRCPLPRNVTAGDFDALTACVVSEMMSHAGQRGISEHVLSFEATGFCLDMRLSWWPRLTRRTPPLQALSSSPCRGKGPTIWLAIIVRDQSRLLPYWLTWHTRLGASHILLYDHLSQTASAIDTVVRPWVEQALVTVIRWRTTQEAAYSDALQRAAAARVDFLGAP